MWRAICAAKGVEIGCNDGRQTGTRIGVGILRAGASETPEAARGLSASHPSLYMYLIHGL